MPQLHETDLLLQRWAANLKIVSGSVTKLFKAPLGSGSETVILEPGMGLPVGRGPVAGQPLVLWTV